MINKFKTLMVGATILASVVSYAKVVEVKDVTGVVKVNTNPKRVVALDNRTFETLEDWGVKLVAAPQNIISKELKYKTDKSISNLGNHKETNFELLAAANPDLVIIGQRFAGKEKTIKEIVPQATVINLNWDVSGKDGKNSGEALINGLKTSTETLGKIFEKEKEAKELIAQFDASIAKVKKAYNGKDKVMGVNVNGQKIGYSAPSSGRVWGPIFEFFKLNPALTIKSGTNNHKGDDVSVEAIAASNPDIILVMDRNAAVAKEAYTPAAEVIANNPALSNVNAVKNNKMVYAPADTYVNESIQTYIEVFNDMAKTFSK